MAKKLTKLEILERLELRNLRVPQDKQVNLFPKSQKYINQTSPLQFKCSNNHKWNSTTGRVINYNTGCPHCKKHNERINKRKPIQDIIAECQAMYGDKYNYDNCNYNNSTTPFDVFCNIHNTKFSVTPFNHINKKQQCPLCQSDAHKDNFIKKAKSIHGDKYKYTNVVYQNKTQLVIITCPTHGDFQQRRSDHLRGHGCKKCAFSSFSIKQISWLDHIQKNEQIDIQHACNGGEFQIPNTQYSADGYCVDTNTVYEFHGDVFHGNPDLFSSEERCHPFYPNKTAALLYQQTIKKENKIKELGYNLVVMWENDFNKTNIPLLNETIHGNFYPRKRHEIPKLLLDQLKLELIDEEFKGYKHVHLYRCLKCGDSFSTTLTQRKQAFIKRHSTGCPKCNKKNHIAHRCYDTIMDHMNQGAVNNNTLFLDNITVELIPIQVENIKYDIIKKQQAIYNSHQLRLISVFEDEWIDKQQMIINKISHYTHHNTQTPRIHARKCKIIPITNPQKREFLNNFHIQGNDAAAIQYGASFNDEIVAVMTFTHPRVLMGYKSPDRSVYHDSWELSRFATNTNYRIPGIASKLLAHFQKNHQWSNIISYADRRWSVGNLYHKLGFDLIAQNPPDYHYIIDGKRKHRWNYRKDKLKETLVEYDSNLTEYQNMVNAGYWRVWGCGTNRYELHCGRT